MEPGAGCTVGQRNDNQLVVPGLLDLSRAMRRTPRRTNTPSRISTGFERIATPTDLASAGLLAEINADQNSDCCGSDLAANLVAR